MTVPLYQRKAELFRVLGHPVRIRVLELLGNGPVPVRELLDDLDVEASNLSQQLAVLRRAGVVTAVRGAGGTVIYALAGPDVAELLAAARRFLTEILSGQVDLLDELRTDNAAAGRLLDELRTDHAAAGRPSGPTTLTT